MAWQLSDLRQESDGLPGGAGIREYAEVGGNPNEPCLRDRAGGPTVISNTAEPVDGPRVMNVIRPGECHQHVHVEESGQRSSRAASTISGVIGGAPSRTRKVGKSEE